MKKNNMIFQLLLIFCHLSVTFCSDSKNEEVPITPTLNLSESKLSFDRLSATKTVNVTTTESSVKCEISGADWCTANYNAGVITVLVQNNPNTGSRATIITVSAGSLKKSVSIMQEGRNSDYDDIKADIKISVKSGAASSSQGGAEFEKSFDNDYSTLYHSNWSNSGTNYFPITLTYNFENASTMNYLVYHPRSSGDNGNIKEFDLFVATEDNPTLTKYGSYDFGGAATSSRISFNPALNNPTKIEFVVKSGAGDGQGFVSCAEMEFYRTNPDNFDYLTIFADHSCSSIKAGVTEATILAIPNNFFKNLALEIFRKEYDTEFRVQEYKAWQNPEIMAKTNKTRPYSLRDNPTGIFVNTGEELIFFASDLKGKNVSILIQDLNSGYGGSTLSINTGINKMNVSKGGLIYVQYLTDTGTDAPIKIHFASGSINGYFDSQKHSKADWKRILDKATYKQFDVLGKNAHLTFPTEDFRTYTPDGLALINKYDELVEHQFEFLGLVKYGKTFHNRMYFHVDYNPTAYMYATSYRTAYGAGTMDLLCSLDKLVKDPWGPAHEVGHVNQTRPGLMWIGLAEVTNNIMSLNTQTKWGNTSRLIAENRYGEAKNALLNKGVPHGNQDVFVKLVPFWQLKLYIHDVLGNNEFYKDLYEYVRTSQSDTKSNGFYQLDFVKNVCNIAQLDLTDFFESWGFLTPCDLTIDDYGIGYLKITQAEVDAVKAEIASKGYAKPSKDITEIRDDNLSDFR